MFYSFYVCQRILIASVLRKLHFHCPVYRNRLSWAILSHSRLSAPLLLKTILISSFHRSLVFCGDSSIKISLLKFCFHFSSLPTLQNHPMNVLHACFSAPPNQRGAVEYKLYSTRLCSFVQVHTILHILWLWLVCKTPFSDTQLVMYEVLIAVN